MSIAEGEACATLTIDLAALASNWSKLQAIASPAECAAVVKADAYGIGIEEAAPALARAGCRTFFVAHASEGRRVRVALGENEPGYRIYILNGLPKHNVNGHVLTHYGLRPVLCSLEEIRDWSECSERVGVGLPAALQIDTGMNRIGLPPGDIAAARALVAPEAYAVDDEPPRHGNIVPISIGTQPTVVAAARRKMAPRDGGKILPPGVYLDLVMSHFVSAELPHDPLNWRQTSDFRKIAQAFPHLRASLANSSGIFLPQHPYFDLVRPGFALYGGNPTPGEPNPMRPVVSLRAPVIQLRSIKAGETAGYNGLWTAQRDSRLATLGVGYADGFPRTAGNVDARATPGAEAIVAGRRCPFVGRTSMDLTILDVTDAPHDAVGPGTQAEILGEAISVDDLAARSGVIGYEILTGLGRRYHRVYRR